MQPENKNSISERSYPLWAKILCWLLAACCMCAIFYFSSRTAAQSSAQSGAVKEFFIKIFGDGVITDFIVRKSAHFLEFAGLGFLFALAFYIQYAKTKTPLSVLFAGIYAVTDEIHQLFVDGRACKLSDWAIDTAGAAAGAFFLLAAVKAAERYKSPRKRN